MNKNNNNNSKFFYSIASHLSSIFNGFGAEVALVGGLVRDLVRAICDSEDYGGEVLGYFNPKDYDVVYYSSDQRKNDPEVLAEYLKKTGHGHAIILEKEFGIVKFKTKVPTQEGDIVVDIDAALPRTESYDSDTRRPEVEIVTSKSLIEAVKTDRLRRDFTCNALYLPLPLPENQLANTKSITQNIWDFGTGIRDITGVICDEPVIDPETGVETGEVISVRIGAKTLNWVNDPALTIEDDPIRVLRGIGFKFRKGYQFSEDAKKGLESNLEILLSAIGTKKCSWEKIREEIHKVISTVKGIQISRYFRCLQSYGILDKIMPEEVSRMVGFDQRNPHHSKDLWWHSLDCLVSSVNYFDSKSEEGLEFDQKADPEDKNTISLREYLDTKGSPTPIRELLVLAALLHDVAKAATEEEYKCQSLVEGVVHYYHHTEKSAKLAEVILKRLHYSNVDIEVVKGLISTHMSLKDGDWDTDNYISPATIRRRRCDFCPKGIDLQRLSLVLILGDDLSHHSDFATDKKVKGFEERFNEYLESREPEPEFKIDGNDVSHRYGLSGIDLGRRIKELKDLQLEVNAANEEALFFEWELRDIMPSSNGRAIFRLGSEVHNRLSLQEKLNSLVLGKDVKYSSEDKSYYDFESGNYYRIE